MGAFDLFAVARQQIGVYVEQPLHVIDDIRAVDIHLTPSTVGRLLNLGEDFMSHPSLERFGLGFTRTQDE